jgi:hypothetical protein
MSVQDEIDALGMLHEAMAACDALADQSVGIVLHEWTHAFGELADLVAEMRDDDLDEMTGEQLLYEASVLAAEMQASIDLQLLGGDYDARP